MTLKRHAWNLPPTQAQAIQTSLAKQVVTSAELGQVTTVTGVDASYRQGLAQAAVVTLSYPELALVEYAVARRPVGFPYVPGLLSFREGPVVLDALDRLKTTPNLLIFDGQGVAHPRRLGIACHIGVLVDLPAIGCAKSRLVGRYQEPGPDRGDYSLLLDQGETLGAVLRTRPGVKPLFVSVGHRVDLPTSIHYVLTCCRRYRLPETTRWADKIAGGQVPK